MFPSYRNQSVDLRRKTGFYMMGTLVVKGLDTRRRVNRFLIFYKRALIEAAVRRCSLKYVFLKIS